ncbi:MAG: class I SAM-dependent methyltransferase [Gammaproteobacteria bacterium]|nr:class I SAM-dependent methyltransferase [Gammaproteobacteria bacterium]MBU1440040.1 class I SAM-dependent methyltransferase [Gammaproteobacteria bacterium]MBU2285549.1 class I SAM-dependent methyltransferase [Gammaproteobacteria bacterium]
MLREAAAAGYRFTTVTPLTHQRVLARGEGEPASTLRDVFGWNLPFDAGVLGASLHRRLNDAGLIRREGALWRSHCRIASIGRDLFLHSAFPTVEADAIFFGPDTYRFARFLREALQRSHAAWRRDAPVRVLDIGCGSGAGGIVVARALAAHGLRANVTMNDINPRALDFTAANAKAAAITVEFALGDALSAVDGPFDLVVCNPPYLDDDAQRAYRHGGSGLGRALAVRFVREALPRLAPDGQLLMYTGVAMVDGQDPFLAEIEPVLQASGCEWRYDEIDPDVFGEEIERAVYARVDRIAAVGLAATRPGAGPARAFS